MLTRVGFEGGVEEDIVRLYKLYSALIIRFCSIVESELCVADPLVSSLYSVASRVSVERSRADVDERACAST